MRAFKLGMDLDVDLSRDSGDNCVLLSAIKYQSQGSDDPIAVIIKTSL